MEATLIDFIHRNRPKHPGAAANPVSRGHWYQFTLRRAMLLIAIVGGMSYLLSARNYPSERAICKSFALMDRGIQFYTCELVESRESSLHFDDRKYSRTGSVDSLETIMVLRDGKLVQPRVKDLYVDRPPIGILDEVRCYRDGKLWRFSNAANEPAIPAEITAWYYRLIGPVLAKNTILANGKIIYQPKHWVITMPGMRRSGVHAQVITHSKWPLPVYVPTNRDGKIFIPDSILEAASS